jgi:Peptidase family M49
MADSRLHHANRQPAPIDLLIVAGVALMVAGCTAAPPPPTPDPAVAQLDAKIRRFAPVDITADTSALPDGERHALVKLIEAAHVIDGLYLEQVWAGNPGLLVELAADRTPVGQAALHYFLINKGPWSALDDDAVFLEGRDIPARPPQGNFYPADATKEEVARWFARQRGRAYEQATGFFSVIRRAADGKLMPVPYSVEYRNALVLAARDLQQAAELTSQLSLKSFLELRAGGFLSNDYYPSDMAWMELDASIEPTIGPYETYEDRWFGYKAAFEAFITLRDDAETAKLATFAPHLQGLENALPIDAKYRNPQLGALSPIRVVNVVFAGGEGNVAVQTTAFNLPNDDRVIREKGSKRVMLKNVQQAKFDHVLVPISTVVLPAAEQSRVSFDAFFTHTVMHEIMHGLGPHQVFATGQAIRLALKDTYAAIEEAKADISGLWALQQLADQGVVSADVAKSMYTTFLASAFRSIRFGLTDAHGKGVAMQLNYLLDHGGVTANADGTFSVVPGKIKDAVAGLTHDLMTIEAEGDYAGAQALLTKMAVIQPDVQRALDKLTDVPVDIEPRYVTAAALTGTQAAPPRSSAARR